jgi:hypothetical protein
MSSSSVRSVQQAIDACGPGFVLRAESLYRARERDRFPTEVDVAVERRLGRPTPVAKSVEYSRSQSEHVGITPQASCYKATGPPRRRGGKFAPQTMTCTSSFNEAQLTGGKRGLVRYADNTVNDGWALFSGQKHESRERLL